MRPSRPLLALLALTALGGCQRAPEPQAGATAPITLQLFGPRRLDFDTQQGRGHNDYLFVEQPRRSDAAWRDTLLSALRRWPEPAGGPWAVRSAYVYERGDRIGPQYSGDAESLAGVFDGELVAYARWTAGQLETAWVIERGEVVFDLLLKRAVQPAFEFD